MFIRTVCFSLFRNVKRLEVYLRLYMNFTLFNLFIQSREKPHLSSLFCTSREREKYLFSLGIDINNSHIPLFFSLVAPSCPGDGISLYF